MSSLAGSLTTFSRDLHPRDFPLYDHDNLGACFRTLDQQLRQLLETVVPSNYLALPLKLVQPSIYATAMDDEKYFAATRLFLAIGADVSQADLISRVPTIVKICSADMIDHLVQRGLTGVPLTHVPSPPSAIPVKLNYQYFSLSQSGGPWETILRSRNLAAWIPNDFPNPQLEIVVVFPQAS
jgi:type VI secretion system protein ImpJ